MKYIDRFMIVAFGLILAGHLYAQKNGRTEVFSNRVKSLQAKVAGELISEPYIELDGDRRLEVSFDVLNHTQGRYAYSIIHCDADWKPSVLTPIEYMDGFQGMTIEDYSPSFNTTVSYMNYRLFLPNDNIRFKVSGNYLLQIYEEEKPDQIVCTVRFGVYEPLIGIDAVVSGNTDISLNREHQQVSFQIDRKGVTVNYPQTELKVYVYQNNRTDNAVKNVQPQIITNNRLTYEHIRELIFEAGNEYRRFEFLTHRYNGLNIDGIGFHNPYYHADVMIDQSRTRTGYRYDQDQDGRFFVRCSGCNDPDTEADYYIVHFTYASEPLLEGDVYLLGDFVQNQFNETSRMEYNPQTRQYEKALMLKQGYYNYQYVLLPHGETKAQTLPTEGDYYQTENEYTILVYHRPMGIRYDRLIGKLTLRNRQFVL